MPRDDLAKNPLAPFFSTVLERIVLDTSAYSRLRGGHAETIDCVARARLVLVPAIVVGELEAAFLAGRRAAENLRALEEFIARSFVELLPVTREAARRYAEIALDLRRAGTPIPTNDMWIAATSLASGARLITFDRHFTRIAGLPHLLLSA